VGFLIAQLERARWELKSSFANAVIDVVAVRTNARAARGIVRIDLTPVG
jgi:hypothetical protein